MDPNNTAPLRVLLVEDSAHDVLAFRRAFKKSHVACEITHCVRAEQALERLSVDLEDGAASFDLIVTDYKLPGMTGLELCREVLKRNISLPLVLLTGTGSEHLAVEALKTGVSDYIIKDPDQGYLDLLPVVLPEVVRQHDDRLARQRAEETLRAHSEQLEEMFKARTQELRETQERLVRQEKLAVLGQLAGGVGHELRNPLAVIKSSVYLLNMVLQDPQPEAQRTLASLEKQVEICDRIINSLLDFARTRSPVWQDVDVNEVLQTAILRVTRPENVKLVARLDESLPCIRADPDQLVHVFGNIILNGYQAMPEGGRLVIQSRALAPDWVAVSLADTGVGISKENMNKLFEPLFTTKSKGIGLGLAITLTLVEGHGGEIQVQSEPGKGSTFTVKLPVGEGCEA